MSPQLRENLVKHDTLAHPCVSVQQDNLGRSIADNLANDRLRLGSVNGWIDDQLRRDRLLKSVLKAFDRSW